MAWNVSLKLWLGIGLKHVVFLELWLGMADEHEELLSCGFGWLVLSVCVISRQDITGLN